MDVCLKQVDHVHPTGADPDPQEQDWLARMMGLEATIILLG
jgi:hypothetical protein